MKKLLLITAIIFATHMAVAQEDPTPPPPDGNPFAGMDNATRIHLMRQFDKDGDGRLSPQERREAMEALKEKSAELDELRNKHAEKVISKFDKDGDGKLDKEELSAFLDEQRKMFDESRERTGRRRSNMKPPAEILAKYDKDGNGELSREERRAMFEDARKRHTELVNKYDKDGDGKLSEEESAELMKDPEVRQMMRRFINMQQGGPGGGMGPGGPDGPGNPED